MALSAAQQAFLRSHPTFASLLAGSDAAALRTFKRNHPEIAQAWNTITTQRPAPAPTAPRPPAAAATSAPVLPTPGGDTNASARASIVGALDSVGLGALGEWAWGQYLNGVPTSQIMLDLRNRPEYQARFPAMAALAQQGRAMSEQQYMQAEESYRQQMRAAGLPVSYYDGSDDFAKLIVGGVSAQEFGDRLALQQRIVMQQPRAQEYRDELARLYGWQTATGAVTAMVLDPDRALPVLQQQFAAAATAAAAARSTFGELSQQEAERIAGTGVSEDEAGQTFASLATMHELQDSLPGLDRGVSRQDLLDAGFQQDAAAQQRVARKQAERKAQFQGGGGYAAGQKGISGLGSAAT